MPRRPGYKAKPACVLIFSSRADVQNGAAYGLSFKKDTLSKDETSFLCVNDKLYTDKYGVARVRALLTSMVHHALILGFRFQDEASRMRWKTGEAFEMYRGTM